MTTEPVVTAASIAGVLSALVGFLRIMGWLPMTDDQFEALMTLVGLLLPILFGIWARNYTTPVSDPKAENTQGKLVPLVPADGSQLPDKS